MWDESESVSPVQCRPRVACRLPQNLSTAGPVDHGAGSKATAASTASSTRRRAVTPARSPWEACPRQDRVRTFKSVGSPIPADVPKPVLRPLEGAKITAMELTDLRCGVCFPCSRRQPPVAFVGVVLLPPLVADESPESRGEAPAPGLQAIPSTTQPLSPQRSSETVILTTTEHKTTWGGSSIG